MSRRIVLTSPTWVHAPDELSRLTAAGFELEERYDLGVAASEHERADGLSDAWGVVAGGERYGAGLLEATAGSLRVIGRPGAGFDAIDVEAATSAGTAVFTTPGVNKEAVADFALTLMLAALRGVTTLDREVRSGDWRATGPSRDLHGATVGIIGLGAIGRTVAHRLSGFECRVIGCDPMMEVATAQAAGIELLPLEDLLEQAQVLTLHAALTPVTRGLIDAAALQRMRTDAILVNTSRGPLIRQDDLVEALRHGSIAGAALDVFEVEPLAPDDPLLSLPNVVVSSHVSSHTGQSIAAMVGGVVDGMLDLSDGRAPTGLLNPEALEREEVA